LDNNRLSGPIPLELGALLNLHSLHVAGNDIDGAVTFATNSSSRDASNQRLLLLKLGFEKAVEVPLFGHGLGALQHMDSAPIGHDGNSLGVHNLYLMLLGEAGIVPCCCFFFLVSCCCVRSGSHANRSSGTRPWFGLLSSPCTV